MRANPPTSKYTLLSDELFIFGSSFLVFYASLILSQTAFFFLDLPLQNASAFLALFTTLAYFAFARKTFRPKTARTSAWLALIFLSSVIAGIFSSFIVDTSWDGRDYHQKAVRQLIGGWNPIYQEIEPKEIYYNAWLNHYPKAAWLSSASIVKLTGEMEVGKTFNLLLILSVFALSFSCFILTPALKTWQAFALSLLLAANPVSVYQSLSYYQDGQVSSSYILLLLLGLCSLRKRGISLHLTLISTVIIGLNLKFTGTAYFAILLAGLFIVNMVFKKNLRLMLPLIFSLLTGALIGLFVVGYNPYVTNALRYGHPFYPVYGSTLLNKEYILHNQAPANFSDQGQIKKLFLSVFSRSENVYGEDESRIKNPFSLDIQEIKEFAAADVRIGGWGPLFGAALIVSALSLIWVFLVSRKAGILGLGLSGFVLGTALLNSECWWARYSPQLYLIPIIILAITWITGRRKLNLIGYLLAGIIILNIFFVSGSYVSASFKKTINYRAEVAEIVKSREDIFVYYGPLDSITVDLEKFHIPYHPVTSKKALPCPQELLPNVFYSYSDCSNSSWVNSQIPSNNVQ